MVAILAFRENGKEMCLKLFLSIQAILKVVFLQPRLDSNRQFCVYVCVSMALALLTDK